MEQQNPPQQPIGLVQFAHGAQDACAGILNECRDLQKAIDEIEGRLRTFHGLQQSLLSGDGGSSYEVSAMESDIMRTLCALVNHFQQIKSRPGSGLPQVSPQVASLDGRIERIISSFKQQQSTFLRDVKEQQKRQYLVVNPNATEAELRAITEAAGDEKVLEQALISAQPGSQAQSELRGRHNAIQQTERNVVGLDNFLREMDAPVNQQDPKMNFAISQAEQGQMPVVDGNVNLHFEAQRARSRRKRQICCGISLLIIAVKLAILLVVLKQLNYIGSNKDY
ncbi:t-SNARE [Myriangium duriaei CBS 260.36]|uniref:t-SNARE n=1 Tax=Myriangium duriaei CBS 260.36 TaxID=1168546 RepID=A0A9P4MLN0_9PEZI|nr:t-SNARE [Myriangium duriaei CBS 260.36]